MAGRDIIVMGASAGGISALRTILSSLPWDLRASIFIVLHSTEDSPGFLPEIRNRKSKLPVLYSVHDAPVLPGRVYIARPGITHMVLERGRVRLVPGPRENRHRPSVDALFRTAAVAYGSRVVGVVLTGNLDDGSLGLAEIKQRGGMAIVQDPADAQAPSMPMSALENVDVDFTLSAAEIGARLVELVSEIPQPGVVEFPLQAFEATGQPYSCPECDGVLEEVEEGGMVRFRCRVGHVYSPESLHADMNVSVERALWTAIRVLEEHADFSARLAARFVRKERQSLADRFSDKSKVSMEDASVLRNLLVRSAQEVLEEPEQEKTGT